MRAAAAALAVSAQRITDKDGIDKPHFAPQSLRLGVIRTRREAGQPHEQASAPRERLLLDARH